MKQHPKSSLIIPNCNDASPMQHIEYVCECGNLMTLQSVDMRYVEGKDITPGEIRKRIRIRLECDRCQNSEIYRVAVVEGRAG